MRFRGAAAVLFAVATAAFADDTREGIGASAPPELSARARQAASFAIVCANTGDQHLSLTPSLALPQGWRMLGGEESFTLEAHSRDARLVSFLIPRGADAGRYSLDWRLRDTGGGVAAHGRTVVVIEPEVSFSLHLLESPAFVIAGREYTATFVLSNTGNAAARVDVDIESSGSLPWRVQGAEALAGDVRAGGQVTLTVTVRTDGGLRGSHGHMLQLVARTHGVPLTAAPPLAARPAASRWCRSPRAERR